MVFYMILYIMDLIQRKLTKNEWESIEIPVPIKEKNILLFIKKSFHDVLNKLNNTKTLLILQNK